MNIEIAREIAAQCWCGPETSGIEMDTRLAEAFATRLNETISSMPSPPHPREHMAQWLRNDADLRQGYVANIAMLLHDRYGITDYETRNAAGDDIMNLVFES